MSPLVWLLVGVLAFLAVFILGGGAMALVMPLFLSRMRDRSAPRPDPVAVVVEDPPDLFHQFAGPRPAGPTKGRGPRSTGERASPGPGGAGPATPPPGHW